MSASLQTTNYKLPYFAENDNTDWSAYNESMGKIDTQLFSNAGAAENVQNQISAIQDSVQTITDTVTSQQNTITNIQSQTATNTSNINLINQMDIEQNQKIASLEVPQIDFLTAGPQGSYSTTPPDIKKYTNVKSWVERTGNFLKLVVIGYEPWTRLLNSNAYTGFAIDVSTGTVLTFYADSYLYLINNRGNAISVDGQLPAIGQSKPVTGASIYGKTINILVSVPNEHAIEITTGTTGENTPYCVTKTEIILQI